MVRLSAENLALMMEAGYIFLGMQRFQEARTVFEGVSAIKPKSDIPWVALGGVAFCQGKLKEAKKHYKQALKIDPDSVYGKAYLGEALFFSNEKEQALKLLKEVDQTEPQGPIGDFARALTHAIQQGFTPETIAQKKEMKEFNEKRK